jgi:hypothetical protein
MNETRLIDRREFTVEAVLAALSGVVITISSGCGGGSSSSPSSPSMPAVPAAGDPSNKVGSISNNHGHSAVVTGAQLLAGTLVQLDIRGMADHTHTVVLAADALQAIKGGATVATDSTTTSGHLHTVTFNPASSTPGSGY